MMILGKGMIVGASTYLTFLVVKDLPKTEVPQPIIPALMIGMVAYLVGSMFLSVFSFGCTAILHCFILDEDTGGSDFTPEGLTPFLTMNDARKAKDKAFSKIDKDGNKIE